MEHRVQVINDKFCYYFFIVKASYRAMGDAVALWLVRSSPDRAAWFKPWLGTLCCVLGQDTYSNHYTCVVSYIMYAVLNASVILERNETCLARNKTRDGNLLLSGTVTLRAPLSTQVYKCAPANSMLGVTL